MAKRRHECHSRNIKIDFFRLVLYWCWCVILYADSNSGLEMETFIVVLVFSAAPVTSGRGTQVSGSRLEILQSFIIQPKPGRWEVNGQKSQESFSFNPFHPYTHSTAQYSTLQYSTVIWHTSQPLIVLAIGQASTPHQSEQAQASVASI